MLNGQNQVKCAEAAALEPPQEQVKPEIREEKKKKRFKQNFGRLVEVCGLTTW